MSDAASFPNLNGPRKIESERQNVEDRRKTRKLRHRPKPAASFPTNIATYAIVVSSKTSNLWGAVVKALSDKHGEAPILSYNHNISDIKSALQSLGPCLRHVAFVAHWSECGERYVRSIHSLTCEIDSRSPFSDVIWGVITGYNELEALKMVTETEQPLTIRHVVSGSVEGVDLRAFESGIAFNELIKDHSVEKNMETTHSSTSGTETETGGDVVWLTQDSTMLVANAIEDPRTNMIVTSGHARESEWNLGFHFPGGQFRPSSSDGSMHAFPLGQSIGPDAIPLNKGSNNGSGTSREIRCASTPKVYSAAGNCLMGHVNSQNCMALAWMKSCGVRQMFGYTVKTYFGYAGWGVHRYLWANVGDLTFSEAYFANLQALQCRLMQAKEEVANGAQDQRKCLANGAQDKWLKGLMFDRAATVFFGDPSWEARMLPQWCQYEIKLSSSSTNNDTELTIVVQVTTLTSGCWTPTCPDDKTTLPGRPPFLLLEASDDNTKVRPTHVSAELVITPLFVLMPLSGKFDAGEVHVRKVVLSNL